MAGNPRWLEIEGIYRSRLSVFVRVARGVTGERESALESVQEGFADALRHAEDWDGRGVLEAWVWRCVVNRARKAARARPHLVSADAAGDASESVPGELRTRIAELPERQRLVVFLRYFADLDYREIAEVLGVQVGTVSATLHAAHVTLRDALEEVSA
jgi:RNA polymerase sigma-70 factor (ECF subfamily)